VNSGRMKGIERYGSRLSDREYEKRIVELYSGLPPIPDKRTEERIRRRELDLAIDHRLGQDFPMERRDALWDIQRRVEKKRGRLFFHWLLSYISHGWLNRRSNKLMRYLVDEYAKILTEDELQAFFDLEKNERSTLSDNNH